MLTAAPDLVYVILSDLPNWLKPHNYIGRCVGFDFLLLYEVSSINKETIKQMSFNVSKATHKGQLMDIRFILANVTWAHELPYPWWHFKWMHKHGPIWCILCFVYLLIGFLSKVPFCLFFYREPKGWWHYNDNCVKDQKLREPEQLCLHTQTQTECGWQSHKLLLNT